MTRQEKSAVIEDLKNKFSEAQYFYVADSSTLSVDEVNVLRGKFFEKGVKMQVVKNTLARMAIEQLEDKERYEEILASLKGPTALLFTDTANAPAKVIKEFREDHEKPVLKSAYIESAIYVGDDQLKMLAELKSKEELIGDIILLLQSPMKNVIGSLKSGGHTLAGLVKALEERAAAQS